MPEANEHSELMHKIGVVEGKIDGIITRLETQNGRVGKLEGKIDLIEKQQARADGRLTAYGWVFGAVVAFGGLLLATVQFYLSYIKKG